MRVAAILLGAMALTSGCTSGSDRERILRAVRQDSAKFCSTSKEGCEFRIIATADGWSVDALPIRRDERGARGYAPGDFESYHYDKQGKLLSTMPGL